MPNGFQTCNDVVSRAYHGTSHQSAVEIIQSGFRFSSCYEPYLGHGVYFFNGQLEKAKDWARLRKRQTGHQFPVAVIRSDVRYGRYIDLADRGHREALSKFVQAFERKTTSAIGFAAAIDIVAEKLQVEIVTGVRVTRRAAAIAAENPPDNGFSADVEIIICVRKMENILSKEQIWSGL